MTLMIDNGDDLINKINDIKTMGMIHDIGKIVIDLNILQIYQLKECASQ